MTGDGAQGRGPDPDGDEAELRARMQRLEAGLGKIKGEAPRREARSGSGSGDPSALGRAFRLSTEFVAGIIAGGLLGWGFDYVVGTRPWGMIVFLMLGFAAGIYNVMRASGFLTPPSGPSTS